MRNLKGATEVLAVYQKFLESRALSEATIKEIAVKEGILVPPSILARMKEKTPVLAELAERLGIVGKSVRKSAGEGGGNGRESTNFALLVAQHPDAAAKIAEAVSLVKGKQFEVKLASGDTGLIGVQIAFKRVDKNRPTRKSADTPTAEKV